MFSPPSQNIVTVFPLTHLWLLDWVKGKASSLCRMTCRLGMCMKISFGVRFNLFWLAQENVVFFTATQGARLVVVALLLWVISKTDKAGIHLFEKFKPSTLLTDGELLKFFTVTCCVINCISSIPEHTGIILFFVLVCSSSKTCSSLSTFPPI